MRKKLVEFLLSEDVVFGKVTNEKVEGFTLFGKTNTIYEKVFGNSKEEILEKMILIKKEHLKIDKLPTKEEFIKEFKNGNLTIEENKLYRFKFSQFIGGLPTCIREEYGHNIIKEFYFNEYFYMDASTHKFDYNTDCSSFELVRRNNNIDWNILGRHKKLISTFDDNIIDNMC